MLRVKLQNKGNRVLKITNLRTSCGCTTVKLKTKNSESPFFGMEMGKNPAKSKWQANLAPSQKGELIIVVDLTSPHVRIGHLFRIVFVRSNDPVHPLLKIQLEAEIVK